MSMSDRCHRLRIVPGMAPVAREPGLFGLTPVLRCRAGARFGSLTGLAVRF